MVVCHAASEHQSFVGFFVFISFPSCRFSRASLEGGVIRGFSVLGLYGFMYVRSVLEGFVLGVKWCPGFK